MANTEPPQSFLDLPAPLLPRLAPRARDSHKGNFGHALLVGGSRGMAGSISLSIQAALRMGAGLATGAVPECCLGAAAVLSPSAMHIPLVQDDAGKIASSCLSLIEPWFSKATAIACGPGLGRSEELQRFVRTLWQSAPCPVVFDADALNNLADVPVPFGSHAGPRVITPHPGEWSRLCNISASDCDAQREAAVGFAKQHRVVVVLKGYRTLVTDGEVASLNQTGTPAMATGGSGDVLTGVITALICQGLAAREAAQLGVYLHGLAGEIAEREQATHVVLPTELIAHLPAALRTLS